MIIYEVNLDISPTIVDKFQQWLVKHVDDMLALEGFIRATVCDREDDTDTHMKKITVHYYLDSRESLEQYFSLHAAKMREDGIQYFGSQFSAYRRILNVHS